MYRLTTDNPRTLLENALNLFFAKDGDAMVRAGTGYEDKRLLDWIREAMDVTGVTTFPYIFSKLKSNDKILMEALDAWLDEGHETKNGVIAYCCLAMWVAAELRARLKKYEDAEEEGRLWMTPCKVGDKVYTAQDFGDENLPFVDTGTVFAIGIDENSIMWVSVRYESGLTYYHTSDDIGKIVFLTREEAEAALAAMKEQEES